MAAAGSGASIYSASFLPTRPKWRPNVSVFASATAGQSVPATSQKSKTSGSEKVRFEKKAEVQPAAKLYDDDSMTKSNLSLKDYFEQSKDMIRSNDGGPPRWFSPLECGSQSNDSPLLFFLPGIDGMGHGLTLHHQRLGEIFDMWCLHIPIMDRTPFTELVKLVERTVRSENYRSPKRPIYLVGESIGGCLALAVAAHNPDIDLLLILSNPATCFSKSPLQPLIPFLEIMHSQLHLSMPYVLSSLTGIPLRMVTATVEKGLSLQQTVGELSKAIIALSSYLSALADALPGETLLWKLQMLRSASAYANSRLHAVRAQALLLVSGNDQLLPSQEEGERLHHIFPKCEIRKFNDSGHTLFLEDGVDLVTIIKGASFYRRARFLDCVSDYLPPSASEFKKLHESCRWIEAATSPVMLSTLKNGKIVKGLAGIPSKGPVLFVGYHMLLGLEVISFISKFWTERNILVRGLTHPMLFASSSDKKSRDVSQFDAVRVMGAVPVSATNFYKLLSSKSHVLLYPGGAREALHRRGEEYTLFWPERSEFVRMAARFGATIIPFGTVGEDDIGQVVFDYNDQMKIPYFKAELEKMKEEYVSLRTDIDGEVGNQDPHFPLILPKLPGRFYYLFGMPIETKGRKQELRDREKSHELYLEVKSEVERCMAYLKEKRENDPYRNVLPRLIYQATHGLDCEVPSFEL
ncbi:Acyltransferase-like protein [Actinidia chinensis var. chinensis]|uniref:Acyltransferase-like protein n=1 Tax=Actinidia chinensis var. chinensis TaxID=1590841 RepID=A0A2R6RJV1_ACTCC|nr:Acyltransferase-like protein [Actinidia chinensis var. chinensis]